MTHRLSLRSRLTLMVTAVFALTITVTALVGMRAVRHELLSDSRENAQRLLASSLTPVFDGSAQGLPDSPHAADVTEFFFTDANGNEITKAGFDKSLREADPTVWVPLAEETPMPPVIEHIPTQLEVAESGDSATSDPVVLVPEGSQFSFVIEPDVQVIDRDPNTVSVVQIININGERLGIGVSTPLQPVTDSLDTFRRLLWFAVPMLVALVGAITWLVVGRVLAPVHAISSQVRAITSSNIADRVPVYAGNDEISELASTMNEMLGRLQTAQQQQRQLVSDASHELRSPVAASRAQLEVALAHPDGVDWASTGATVLAEQERLGKLIDDLLAASRLDEQVSAYGGGIDAVDVDLDEVVLDDARRPRIVPIRTTIDAPVRLSGDPERLTRIVRNLVDNAARHAQTEVQVTVSTISGYAILHVDDDGPGVDPAHREVIFERFARLDEARSRGRGGTGLGLAIARAAARSYRGDITVSSSPSGGARFTVTFPITVR